jgi:HSP20 family molecular chaperone IbpA
MGTAMENETHENQEVEQSREVAQPKATTRLKGGAKTRSKLILGGAAVLVAGMFLGFLATRYGAGEASAAAATKAAKAWPAAKASAGTHADNATAWNPFQEIRDMQLQMDQMFNQMTTQFRMEPSLNVFADSPGYSLSLRVRDMKDHYEVRAYLPNAEASNVKTSLLDKQTLKVEVSNQTSEVANPKGAKETVSEWGQYAQIIHLPGPVKNEDVRIDQANHQLTITLPKT